MQTQTFPASETPRVQTLSREAFWQRHIGQWRDSGLSRVAYCKQYSLVYHQMVYWCSKETKETDDAKGASSDFIAVSVAPTLSHSALSIRLPNGIAIEGIDERSVALVGRLVGQL
jgi:hypothetical protein